MPASIIVKNLTVATPDGRPLLSDLDLTFAHERTGLVGRNGVGKSTLIAHLAGETAPAAGSVTVSGSIHVLRQVVRPDPSETVGDLFGVSEAIALLARAERGEASAAELAEADWTLDARIASALHRFGLAADAGTRLATLSGGQQTRAALAAAVFAEPDFLILDEPTNNLDRDGRRAVIDFVSSWRGGAIVVSHDRELLDTMDAIVELTSLGARRYGGTWSDYRAMKTAELAMAEADAAEAEKQLDLARRRAQEASERKAQRDKAGRKARARGDAPKMLLDARKGRAEATGGRLAALSERGIAEAAETAKSARERMEVIAPLTVALPPSGLSRHRAVLSCELVSFARGGRPIVKDLSFTITGPERLAVIGPNGSGKTTLLELSAGTLAPDAGRIDVRVPFAFFDQQVSLLDRQASILDNFRRLNPDDGEKACRAALARFRFRAGAALQRVGALSGGEMLRAGLACVLGGMTPPQLLILDEPTNHLDLEAIETVEEGLSGYDGALLLVSHDERFLAAVGVTRRLDLG
jgi:ATPase components of ABC transporters with duplicated ATPase domains